MHKKKTKHTHSRAVVPFMAKIKSLLPVLFASSSHFSELLAEVRLFFYRNAITISKPFQKYASTSQNLGV